MSHLDRLEKDHVFFREFEIACNRASLMPDRTIEAGVRF